MSAHTSKTTSLRLHRDAQRVVFFTGAGLSAAAGIPTFRGKGGIWEQYDYTSYACQEAFDKNPEKVWEFHNMRRSIVAPCEPTQGHRWIARMESVMEDCTVVTQNIDGLHQYAGSTQVTELHGSLWRVRCEECGATHTDRASPLETLVCPNHPKHQRHYWRPDIVWFGDSLNQENLHNALEAILQCDVFVSIGTSGVVFPAAQLPLYAKKGGAFLIEINPDETPMSDQYDLCLRGSADDMLGQLCEDLPTA